jgi:hypothetical protein
MVSKTTLKEIRERSPLPWRSEELGNGHYRVVDTNGVEVPFFNMLGFLELVTDYMALQLAGQTRKENAS